MKRTLSYIFALLVFFTSCKKSTSTVQSDKYMTVSASSSWNYQQTNNATSTPVITTYTVTSTTRDTTINSKSYHIFDNSNGSKQYFNISGSDYYTFDSLPLPNAGAIERLYLKDDVAANGNWVQNVNVTLPGFPLAIPVTITNTVTEKGITRTVNNITYTDVIHVQTAITTQLIPAASFTTNINTYYAKKFGMIENTSIIMLNYAGYVQNINAKIILLSAILK